MAEELNNGGGENLLQLPSLTLAVDLGETTGLALYDLTRNLLRCTMLKHPDVIISIINLINPDILILERFPETSSLDTSVQNAYTDICLTKNPLLISPGEWKPLMRVIHLPFPKYFTQHERDAANLIGFYFLGRRGEDIKWTFA